MNNTYFISIIAVVLTFFCFSCKKKEFESNALLLRKAINSAAVNGEWEEAKSLAFKAREQDEKDPNARTMFALALEQCYDLDRAIEEINVAVSLDSSNFMAHYTKGRLHFKAETYEDCAAPLEKANELQPGNPQVLLLLARTYSILRIYNKAITNYVKLAKSKQYKDKPEVYNELGVLFFKKQDYKRAVRFFNEAYAKDSKSPTVNFNLGAFWDNLDINCFENKTKDTKAHENAVKYYTE